MSGPLSLISPKPNLAEVTTNVALFNDLTLDNTKDMFKKCLGETMPFDVIESVQVYANKLQKFLNSSLDDLLCGSAISDVVDDTGQFYDSMSDAGEAIYDKFATNPLFSSEEEQKSYEQNGLLTSKTVTDFIWLKTYSHKFNEDGSITDDNINFSNGNIGAITVSVIPSPYASVLGDGVSKCEFAGSAGITVHAYGLERGPNDGSSADKDGTNILPTINASFHFNFKEQKFWKSDTTNSFTIAFDSQTSKVNSSNGGNVALTITNPKITFTSLGEKPELGVMTSLYNIEFTYTLSVLNFNGSWCNASSTLNSQQKAAIQDTYNSAANSFKESALRDLKNSFYTSSVVQNAMDGQIEKLKSSYPALEGVDTMVVRQAIQKSVAENAISLVQGNGTVDTQVKEVIATEVTTSSINHVLEKSGIPGNISKDCTKQLLSKAGELIGDLDIGLGGEGSGIMSDIQEGISDGIAWVQDGLSEAKDAVMDFIPFDEAVVFADGVIKDMQELFGTNILSADCLKSINNNFDICNQQIVDAAGAAGDLITAKTRASDLATQQAKQFIPNLPI